MNRHLIRIFQFLLLWLQGGASFLILSESALQRWSALFSSSAAVVSDKSSQETLSIPEGRVQNVTEWLIWSDQESLSSRSTDGKGGIFDRIKSEIGSSVIPKDVHDSSRFVVLSHGNQTDPIYNYGNEAGFDVFQFPSEEYYYKLPSRYSAPPGPERDQRDEVIDATTTQDITFIPEAIRVRYPSSTVILLRDAILWNVYDEEGIRVGQTVLFDVNKVIYPDRSKSLNGL